MVAVMLPWYLTCYHGTLHVTMVPGGWYVTMVHGMLLWCLVCYHVTMVPVMLPWYLECNYGTLHVTMVPYMSPWLLVKQLFIVGSLIVYLRDVVRTEKQLAITLSYFG